MANRRGKVEVVTDFLFLGSKITADSDCSHEIRRRLLLGRKVMTNLDSVLKSRDITLPTNFCMVKVFPGVTWLWELDHKEGRMPNNWCLQLWCWRRLLKVKPVNLKGDQPWIFTGRTDVKLKLQYFGHLMQTADSLVKSLMLGKIKAEREEGIREWDGWTASPMQWTWIWANSGRRWRTGKPGMLQSMGSQSWTRLSNWTTATTF